MKVIWFNGNLGNQVFYCRYKDYLQTKYPAEKVYAYVDPKCPKVRVHDVFNLELPKRNIYINIISFFVFRVLGFFFRRIPEHLIPSWYSSKTLTESAVFIANYIQTSYFYKNTKSDWLKIRMPDNVSDDYRKYELLIGSSNSVCVHIRRGDYIKPGSAYEDLSSTDYYDRAISIAKGISPDSEFFFFSDDLEYVKNRFKGDKFHYVDCNRGANSYLDIKLMSLAKVNIIANSTFSYWGAYINNENKKVIYPRHWFCERTGLKAPDIMLDNWIGV